MICRLSEDNQYESTYTVTHIARWLVCPLIPFSTFPDGYSNSPQHDLIVFYVGFDKITKPKRSGELKLKWSSRICDFRLPLPTSNPDLDPSESSQQLKNIIFGFFRFELCFP